MHAHTHARNARACSDSAKRTMGILLHASANDCAPHDELIPLPQRGVALVGIGKGIALHRASHRARTRASLGDGRHISRAAHDAKLTLSSPTFLDSPTATSVMCCSAVNMENHRLPTLAKAQARTRERYAGQRPHSGGPRIDRAAWRTPLASASAPSSGEGREDIRGKERLVGHALDDAAQV